MNWGTKLSIHSKDWQKQSQSPRKKLSCWEFSPKERIGQWNFYARVLEKPVSIWSSGRIFKENGPALWNNQGQPKECLRTKNEDYPQLQTGDHSGPKADWLQWTRSKYFFQGQMRVLEQLHVVIQIRTHEEIFVWNI